MTRTVAILGANGVYARHLIPRLVGDGYRVRALVRPAVPLVVISASDDELRLHDGMLAAIAKASKGKCLWQALEAAPAPGAVTASSA